MNCFFLPLQLLCNRLQGLPGRSLIAMACLVAMAVPVHATPPTLVTVEANRVIRDDFLGVGVQWSSYPWWDISDDDWTKVFDRVEFMQLPFARVMLDTFWYCQGFDDDGTPIYDWDTSYMRKLYRLLDWCEKNNVRVMIGEWGRPNGSDLDLASDDPRWSRIVADFMEHMLDRRGYTCLQYYNLINEPHGSWSGITWEDWKAAIGNLHSEFESRGLLQRIPLALPDGNRQFTSRFLKDEILPLQGGIYEEHWYVYNREIVEGLLEVYTREQLRQIRQKDPEKHFFLGEIGIMDDKKNDQQMHVFEFWYGVSMADAAIQMMRGGMSGFLAWDLDDAMHINGDGPESMNALGDVLPPDAYDHRKIWGFWDLVGAEHGNPDAERMRPWFFPWSILSRSFPPGCEILEVGETGVPGLRVTAARMARNGKYDLSFAVVNNSDSKAVVRLRVIGVRGTADFVRYDYFDIDNDERVDSWPQTVDDNGNDLFPSPSATLRKVNITEGMTIQLESRGVVVITTNQSNSPVSIPTAQR